MAHVMAAGCQPAARPGHKTHARMRRWGASGRAPRELLLRAEQPAARATLSKSVSRSNITIRSSNSSSALHPPAQQHNTQHAPEHQQPQLEHLSSSSLGGASSSSNSSRRPVISKMVGKRLFFQETPGQAIVPLLHPVKDQLPFAAALSVITTAAGAPGSCAVGDAASSPATRQQQQQGVAAASSPPPLPSSLVELCYVVSGRGYVTSAASGPQQLLPGDSLISLHGAASFAAGPLPREPDAALQGTAAADSHQQQQQPMWSQLLSWLHMLHLRPQPEQQQQQQPEQQQQQQQPEQQHHRPPHVDTAGRTSGSTAKQQQPQQQLVLLQLLLPSELLTGELLMHHAGHFDEVARHLPWSAAAAAAAAAQQCPGHAAAAAADTAEASGIDEDSLCAFLVDTEAAAEQQQHEKHQHQQQRHVGDDQAGTAAGLPAEVPSGRLSQQQVLKRALSEVGAFRLPHQSNRLALLFSPYNSPGLSLSFGVEVFEPGHVTPLHVHHTAHELFFVLAGHGEGVFGTTTSSSSSSASSSSVPAVERVRLSPGDVAVFPPGVLHGLDNPSADAQLFCLQMMLPNEHFVEFVRSGQAAGVVDISSLHRQAAEAASCG